VQRIPRYILLLSDLIKHTSSDHIDYDDLSDALEKIKHVAEFINESKRDSENMMKLNQLQSQLLNKAEKKLEKLSVPGRSLIKEGIVHNQKKDYTIFLFNDLLLHVSKKKNGYKIKNNVPLKGLTVTAFDSKIEKKCNQNC